MMGKVLVKANGGGSGAGSGSLSAGLLGNLMGKPKTALGGFGAGAVGSLQFLTSLADAGANQQDLVSALGSAGAYGAAAAAGAGKVGDALDPTESYREFKPGGYRQQAAMRAAVNANPPPLFPPPPTSPATVIPPLANVMRPAPPPPPPTNTTALNPPPTNTTALSPPTIPNTAPVMGPPPAPPQNAYQRTWNTDADGARPPGTPSPDWYQEGGGGTDFDMQNVADQSQTDNSMADVDGATEFPLEMPEAPPAVTPADPTVDPTVGYGVEPHTDGEESQDDLMQRVLSGGVQLPKSEPMEIAFRLLKAAAR